jgi:C4-dicarboxylate-specific signal transduction histidine kinase
MFSPCQGRRKPEGKSIAIELQDTGKGTPAAVAEKIFLPFFTTKGKGKGSGLGLAVSKRIVEEHGGTIEFANNSSGGVTLMIILPVIAENRGAAS